MPYQPNFTSSLQNARLKQSLSLWSSGGVAILDIDGVLFDTRYRQVRIVQDYATAIGDARLMSIHVRHFEDWSMSTTLVNMGLELSDAKRISSEMRPYWERQFFGDDSVLWDEPLPGAAKWVTDLQAAGATVVYLTGRTESQRWATEEAFRRHGFPESRLMMKPSAESEDFAFKQQAFQHIAEFSEPVRLGIDNEPIQINALAKMFKDSMAIWMDTDHSFRPVRPNEDLPVLKGFLYSK